MSSINCNSGCGDFSLLLNAFVFPAKTELQATVKLFRLHAVQTHEGSRFFELFAGPRDQRPLPRYEN
jgi:hypothetical protein